ncbi:MAG: caspase family protein [Ktedonobacteraceae bacterium]
MRKALIVGIDAYQSASLAGCVNDANKMEEVLRRNEDDSPNFDCKKLVAPTQSITKANLKRNVEELFAYQTDVALFYFSGHGTANNLGGYLVTQDAQAYDEGLSMQDVLTFANKSKAHEVVIILDCCNSGAFGKVPAINDNSIHLREGISVLTASQANQSSIEVNGNGIFTKLIYEALQGGASDVIGNVTVASLYAYTDQILGAWDQRPLLQSHVSKLLPLRKCKPQVIPTILRSLPKYFKNSDYIFPLDPTYEPDKKGLGSEHQNHNQEHEAILKHFQKYRDAHLLIPVGEEHLYYAAIHSKACKLTALGQFYWNLANQGKI